MSQRPPWLTLALVVGGATFLLGFFGREVYRQAPPIPDRVVTTSGEELATRASILDGQQVWQSIGGQQIGSVWGHGAYQAPDWSADWLHREALALRDVWATAERGAQFDDLEPAQQDEFASRVKRELRTNTFDAATGTLTISPERALAMQHVASHYLALFGGDPALAELRESYALHDEVVKDPARLDALMDFFGWTAWSCVTERPGLSYSYTSNWPHEPLVGNVPTAANVVWSLVSILLLLAAVGGLVWYHAAKRAEEADPVPPRIDPLRHMPLTPSMRATGKYGVVALALFVVQVALGALLAHYTVEGDSFYGIPLAEYVPYSIARTWHLQTAMFWIATAFLAAGLFLAPLIGGHEPKFQRLGVNVLFGALVLVVVGSLTGEWFSVHQMMGLDAGFWFGHQGYEYVDLGRAWQIALYIGLILWLVLMLRGIAPALRRGSDSRGLVTLFAGSVVAIGLLYGAGFLYGARSHLAVAEYWRWWVVHLWVEGFFEVFATAALAFLFSRLGLISFKVAARAAVTATAIFLVGGIPGTFHHIYFSGTPVSITAIGATFSALEVVPLVLVGYEALKTLRMERRADWMRRYRWPIRFFVGVAFWNLVGAGLFGFLINPPIALYFMQGLNTTPVHAHTALFGVYGLLSLGLILMLFRRLAGDRPWREGMLGYSFWAMNIGLGLMVALSLLPIGLMQTFVSVEVGLWYARSADFLQLPLVEFLRWLRIVGDTVFITGVAALVWFCLGLKFGWSYVREPEGAPADTSLAIDT
jgi:nitric oxide reductase subunit B